MTATNNITDDKEKEMDRETAAVLKERVAKSTHGGYAGRNVAGTFKGFLVEFSQSGVGVSNICFLTHFRFLA